MHDSEPCKVGCVTSPAKSWNHIREDYDSDYCLPSRSGWRSWSRMNVHQSVTRNIGFVYSAKNKQRVQCARCACRSATVSLRLNRHATHVGYRLQKSPHVPGPPTTEQQTESAALRRRANLLSRETRIPFMLAHATLSRVLLEIL